MDTKDHFMTMMANIENHPYNNNHHVHVHDHDHDHDHDLRDDDQKTTSLGFMELLGYEDYYSYPSSIFDVMTTSSYHQLLPPPSSSLSMETIISTSAFRKQDDNVDEVEEESSVVLNGLPSSPNCSSISSPARNRVPEPEPEPEPVEQCVKDTKSKRKKKEKEPRFAFMTRTEVDHLDDGYRWRKYGQKAVKNSHFPRSYYRCTSASCNVKKRVERCMGDASYVITTYEGKHNHPVIHNSAPLIPSFDHYTTTASATITANTTASAAFGATSPAMLKLEQGGLLQDMLHCHH